MADAYRHLTIARCIHAAAARVPDHIAIIDGDQRRTYRQLDRRIAQVANLGRTHWGIERGDRVALIAPNRIDYVDWVAGLSECGAIVATLNPRLTAPELGAILADCAPRLLLIDPANEAARTITEQSGIATVLLGPQAEALLAATSDRPSPSTAVETDPFALAYTSGTTGTPKGVLLPHRSRALSFLAMAAEYHCFGVGDHFLAMAPMCHGAGFVFACAPLASGGTVSLFPGGDPEAIVRRLGQGDVNGVFLVPTQVARMLDLPPAPCAHRLDSIICNAAALAQPLKQGMIDRFGAGLLNETYGSTEAGIVTNIRPDELLERPGSVGRPFPGVEVELRLGDGAIAAPGEPGELHSRSATGFAGYWNRPADTDETIREGGWITVGDIATTDADGFITIVDRKKDMVVTGGLNVYPREVENVIAALPGVREVAVIGEPDPEYGERLRAFVVASRGAAIDPAAIIAGCRDLLAGFKVPRTVSLIDQLPRNAGGKVLKTELRERP